MDKKRKRYPGADCSLGRIKIKMFILITDAIQECINSFLHTNCYSWYPALQSVRIEKPITMSYQDGYPEISTRD